MLFEFGFYSSLLLITFSQGILYSILLFRKGLRTANKSNYWLSLFIFLCAFYVAPWMLGFAGWYDNQPYRDILFYVPFQHLFLLGPIIYFYTQSLLNPVFRLTRRDMVHFIPGLLYLLFNVVIFIYDRYIFKGYYFYADGTDKDFDSWYQYSGLASMAIYLWMSIRFYDVYQKLIVQVTSFADRILFDWIRNYLIAFLVLMLLPIIFDLVGIIFPTMKTYSGNWWFFLCYSIVVYYLAVTAYANPITAGISFKVHESNPNQILLLATSTDLNAEDVIEIEVSEVVESNPEIESWKEKVETVITEMKLYQNPDFTLTELAKILKSNPSVISKAINKGFGVNFNDLVNHYRTQAVKESFEKGEHKKSTLLGIAYDCGFNSKATFNRAFKKNTGKSPKEFIEKINL